jgi:2'-5' RNA ligase
MPRVVVVVPLEPLRVGERFRVENWPLHITVVPPFATEANFAELANVIADVAGQHPSLTVFAGDERLFGRKNTIPVNLIDDNPDLTRLHHALVDALRPLAATPEERAFTSLDFVAHVTVKRDRRVHAGDRLELAQVALVDMAARAEAGGRAVLATANLSDDGVRGGGQIPETQVLETHVSVERP